MCRAVWEIKGVATMRALRTHAEDNETCCWWYCCWAMSCCTWKAEAVDEPGIMPNWLGAVGLVPGMFGLTAGMCGNVEAPGSKAAC